MPAHLAAMRAPDRATRSKVAIDFAVAALRAGDVVEARRLLEQQVALDPADAEALVRLSRIAIDQRRIEDSTLLARRAATVDPTLPRRLALAHHLLAFVGPDPALAEIEGFPAGWRTAPPVQALEATLLGLLGRHAPQIAIYEALARQVPDDPALWKALGDALKTVGRADEAVAALRRAIAVRASYGEAWWTLANFKSVRFTDADLAAMKKAVKGKLADADALHFHFALGKALEERGQAPAAFRHYAAGNAIRARSFRPEDMSATRAVDTAIATFTPALYAARAGHGCPARDPIFVVGLQRSGSTLVEQILASHPQVEGTTELTVMPQLWDKLVREATVAGRSPGAHLAALPPADLAAIGEEYLARTRAFRQSDAPHFVDKLPANWMAAGFIRLVLPNATIIDARRHPMACGWSNFKQHYATGVAFAYSLEAIGTFTRDYWRFMAHLDAVQPGAIHRVINERLIADPEGETRRLIAAAGLPFDAACLSFHANRRAVRTPSAEQVRRPINADGVDAWKPFAPFLEPLRKALGDGIARWDALD